LVSDANLWLANAQAIDLAMTPGPAGSATNVGQAQQKAMRGIETSNSETLYGIFAMRRMFDSIRCPSQFFTSNRRMEDQFPGLAEASLARARHHIVRVGRVLLLN
jgi:hypothetical protein